MKLNKNIFKLLGLTLFISNFSLYHSVATSNNEIPSRYQTLEGEYITIDDSEKGELHEIEIFGNTVQDEDNLEDIQSVGDLYVDEDENPILDNQGREQYKVSIISTGRNLFDGTLFEDDGIVKQSNGKYKSNKYLGFTTSRKLVLKPNTTYTFSIQNPSVINTAQLFVMARFTIGENSYTTNYWNNGIKLSFETDSTGIVECEIGSGGYAILDIEYDIQLEEGTSSTSYTKYEKHIVDILLPVQLQKVGDIADRLYWDNSKGRYVIEKNVQEFIYSGEETIGLQFSVSRFIITNVFKYKNPMPRSLVKAFFTKEYNNIIKGVNDYGNDNLYFSIDLDEYDLLGYSRDELGVKELLKDVGFYGILFKELLYEQPELIETNITSKIKIPTYEEKTHIYVKTENGINPTLKVKVDRINKLSQESVDTVENEPTIYNLSRARIMVNQMEEGELKEELQQRLNNISALNDLELERKTSTSNVDIYIKSENMLLMSLSTNSITFEDYSGVDDIEISNAIKISINSSLPYQLNAYLIDEIYNSDKSKKIDIDRLNIKDNDDVDYKEFAGVNQKLTLKSNCNAGNDISHNIDFKLKGDDAYPADIYKTVIKFEAEQK